MRALPQFTHGAGIAMRSMGRRRSRPARLPQSTRSAGIAAAVAILCAGAVDPAAAGAEPFGEAQLFFELNDTDGDLGIYSKIDGEPWVHLVIEDPGNRTLLDILATSRLRKQGMTEIFFESAEPSFDELSPRDFLKRFPSGHYEARGFSQSIGNLRSEMFLSHVMPAPAGDILIGGIPAAEDCDADPLPTVPGNQTVSIAWDAVTSSHPDIGQAGPVSIAEYEVVLEAGDVKLAASLPPGQTSLQVPASFLALSDAWKLEILVRATNHNRTAIETCFLVQ